MPSATNGFDVVGPRRGSYVAYRTTLDHPYAIDRLVVMDEVPVVGALERCDARGSPRCGGFGPRGELVRSLQEFLSAR